MEAIIIRLAEVEKKVSGEHFKKICIISTDLVLARLTSAKKDHTSRLGYILQKAKCQMNDTITMNGRASREQRGEIKGIVTNRDGRLNREATVFEMESGLKQLQSLEAKLIETIQTACFGRPAKPNIKNRKIARCY